MGRTGLPGEVAAAVVRLLGEGSANCTGSVLDVAGGR
jgi:NAD(P)-dependent dehydrogenase (short-subunit alcohol dehydrogenase family)